MNHDDANDDKSDDNPQPAAAEAPPAHSPCDQPQPESVGETDNGAEANADAEGERDEPSGSDASESGEEGGEPQESDGREDEGEAEPGSEEGDEEDEDAGEEGEALPIAAVVEAVLFAAREPLKPAQIARAVGKRTRQDAVRAAVEELNVHYLETGRAFEIAEISERYQLMSRPEYARHIMRIYPKRELQSDKDKSQRLTPAALDTLAIIAYKQPVMRSEIERIRGVACGPVLKMLIERGSVKPVGRLEVIGKPTVFGTTEKFLAEFGLGSLDELPLRNSFLPPPGEEPKVELFPEENGGENAAAAPETPGEETPAPESAEPPPTESLETEDGA